MSCSRDPKAPRGQGKHVLLEKHWALGWDSSAPSPQAMGYLQKEAQAGRKLLSHPLLNPMARPLVLGPLGWPALTRELGGHQGCFPGSGKEWKQDTAYSYLSLLSYVHLVTLVHSLPHRCILERGGGWCTPPPEGIGARGGGSRGGRIQRRPNSEEKLCLGKAVALIQNDPLKRAMKGFLLWLIDS